MSPREWTDWLALPRVLDGALGTQLDRRGVPTPAPLWSVAALRTHADAVQDIHREYVAAGAEILTTCSFRLTPGALHASGLIAANDPSALADAGRALAHRAVQLARAAAAGARPPLVVASLGPIEDCYRPELVPDDHALRGAYAERVDWFAATDADALWFETIGTRREALTAAETAATRGLPFVVSLMLDECGALLGGDPLRDTVRDLLPLHPVALGLNCIPPAGLTRLLPRLRDLTSLPLAAYAHVGNVRPLPGWSFAESPSPAEYADAAAGWSALGASIIGGCCGTTPADVAALAQRLRPCVGKAV